MLEWRTIFIPLSAGANTGADPRALEAPALAVCRDAMFEEVGGAQTRYPFVSIGNNIFGGGTLSNVRKVVPSGDELLTFTKDTLYSWNAQAAAWVSRGTHLAVKVKEQTRFVNTQDQVACERAELNGVVIIAWIEKGASNDSIYWSAYDKTTGAVLRDRIGGSAGTKPRMVVTTNRIILFFEGNPNLLGISFDPASLPTTFSSSTIYTAANGYSSGAYDVVASGTTAYLVATRSPTTSYEIMTVSEALSVSRVTKARTATGVAIALAPNGTHLTVARSTGAAVESDYLSIAGPFTDVTINQAIFAADGVSAAAYRSVTDSGQYRCYIFGGTGGDQVNYVDTGGTIGVAATHVIQTTTGSRAFDHDGRVYIWKTFAEESGFSGAGAPGLRAALQNTYFLYRDDGFLVAKAATHKGAGVGGGLPPQVQSLGSGVYALCLGERRVIPIGQKQKAYAARAPREVLFTFDSNEARRVAKLGQTLYISGGEILQYDGVGLYEVGFHVFPWYFGLIEVANPSSIEDGAYTYKVTWRWDNAKGERDRSTTATHGTVSVTAAPASSIEFEDWNSLPVTHKTVSPPAVEVWRTAKNPGIDAPFYLATSQDPVVLTGDNCYVPNTYQTALLTDWVDGMADATLKTKEASDEVGDVLERLAPPPATIIVATQDRLFLAGISDNPYAIWYSRLRGADEVASFHDTLVVEVPPSGGAITALAFLNETLVAFCEHSVWALPGDGFGNVGDADGSRNYGPARLLAGDVGAVNAEAVALSPRGLEFHSSKGKMLLGKDWSVQYVGSPVVDFDSDTHVEVHVLEKKHEVRWLTTSRMLVFNYKVNQWSEWTVANGVSAAMWNGTHHYASSTAVLAEQTSYGSNVTYAMDLETAWIPVGIGGKLGRGKVLWIQVLGEFVSAHDLRVRVGRDYLSDSSGATLFHSKYWPATPTTAGGRLQVQHAPSIRLMEAVKLRITPYASGSTTNPPTGGALKVTGFALHIGLEKGIWRSLAAAQRQ